MGCKDPTGGLGQDKSFIWTEIADCLQADWEELFRILPRFKILPL